MYVQTFSPQNKYTSKKYTINSNILYISDFMQAAREMDPDPNTNHACLSSNEGKNRYINILARAL